MKKRQCASEKIKKLINEGGSDAEIEKLKNEEKKRREEVLKMKEEKNKKRRN